jgi:hypothetical protein
VAKWPDIGATISTLGCGVAGENSFLKCSSVANGVTWVASSVTGTASPLSITLSIPKGGRLCVTSPSLSTSQAAASLRLESSADQPKLLSCSMGKALLASVRSGHIKSVWAW